jgi:hypothetical protein
VAAVEEEQEQEQEEQEEEETNQPPWYEGATFVCQVRINATNNQRDFS